MVFTMVPLIALCLIVLFASGNFKLGFGADPKDETVEAINPKGVYQVSADTLGFPVRIPGGADVVDGVPAGWKATATRDDDVVGGTAARDTAPRRRSGCGSSWRRITS